MKTLLTFGFLIILFSCQKQQSSKTTATVAMAQIFNLAGDRSGNLARIENAIKEAKEKKAELVVLPETSIYGWVNPEAHKRAYPIPGEDSKAIAQLARKYQISVCIGFAEKEGEKLYDAAVLIDPSGKIITQHRKINTITELMSPPYSRGTDIKVVDSKFGKLGLLICADSFDKEVINRMKKLKPNLLLIPYGWAAKENQWPEHHQELVEVVKNIAIETQATVIGPNSIGQIAHGPWKGLTFGGLSVAYNPNEDKLTVGKDRDRDIILLEVPLKD